MEPEPEPLHLLARPRRPAHRPPPLRPAPPRPARHGSERLGTAETGTARHCSAPPPAEKKLKSECFLQHLHLDQAHCLWSVRNTVALVENFQLLDVHRKNHLNNLQFYCFLHYVTDLNKDQTMLLFDLNHLEKKLIHQHVGPAFPLLDIEGDNMTEFNEFEATRFLFKIQKELKMILKDFHISGDEQLNYREFKIFARYQDTVSYGGKQQKEDHE
ncbi:EF-hand calcium-binding domain-containing protein 9 [Apus apus]|uniref:EF-hand calcium-binding domain-containing protein 9 n=1 Tax=Apus apus TaxID=8895 RepID=UPI0021F86C2C|nr:EF-hand calcium-binding domain-containing protein 9 [Apus apus]